MLNRIEKKRQAEGWSAKLKISICYQGLGEGKREKLSFNEFFFCKIVRQERCQEEDVKYRALLFQSELRRKGWRSVSSAINLSLYLFDDPIE